MCEKHKFYFSDTLHLVFNDGARNMQECVCWVNEGTFILTIVDFRLNIRNERRCSMTKIFIGNQHYECNSQTNTFGSVFRNKLIDNIKIGAYISFNLNSTDGLPEMLWIKLSPESMYVNSTVV